MKKIKKILALIILITSIFFASCEKEEIMSLEAEKKENEHTSEDEKEAKVWRSLKDNSESFMIELLEDVDGVFYRVSWIFKDQMNNPVLVDDPRVHVYRHGDLEKASTKMYFDPKIGVHVGKIERTSIFPESEDHELKRMFIVFTYKGMEEVYCYNMLFSSKAKNNPFGISGVLPGRSVDIIF